MENNIITLAEIQRIQKHYMNLLSYTAPLRQHESTKEVYTLVEELHSSIRKIQISALMYNKCLICVAGLQGAGKTALMQQFYGLDSQYLEPSLGRGERIPVLITETEGISAPDACAVRIDADGNGSYVQQEVPLSSEEFATEIKGTNTKTMYLELHVPYRHTCAERVSFLLLPGFEPNQKYWNDLIEFSINSSDAAVFVFNETTFAHAAVADRIDWIKGRFGKNLIYAITGADRNLDHNASVKKTCVQTLGILPNEEDRVVCTGVYADEAQNNEWINAFKTALEKYAYTDMQQLQKNSSYLYEEVQTISNRLYQIQALMTQAFDDIQISDNKNNAMLKGFDEAAKKQRKSVERHLEKQFEIAKSDSAEKLQEEFENIPKSSLLKRLFMGNTLKQYQKTIDIITKALKDENGCPLSDKYIGLALAGTLGDLEGPEDKTDFARLVSSDVKKNEKGQFQLQDSKNTRAIASDVRSLLAVSREEDSPAALQCRNPKKLMGAIAELGTYYFSQNNYEMIAVKAGLDAYEPAKIDKVPDKVLAGAESSRKFVAGMAGMMGIDILGDGSVNMVTQIASSLGVAAPVAGAAAIATIGAGAMLAVARDINRMQREDLRAAELATNAVYDKIMQDILERYDYYMESIRGQMEDNLGMIQMQGQQVIDVYNTQQEIYAALKLLEQISKRAREGMERIGLRA